MIRRKRIKSDISKCLEELKTKLKGMEEVKFVYVFGSYGRGEVHPLSDFDLAIYLGLEENKYFDKKLEIFGIVSRLLDTDEIDIVILNQAPPTLVVEILRTARLLFSKDEVLRAEFELKNIAQFMDTAWLREYSQKELIKRIEEGRYGITYSD
jgi:hypothetical protein